MTEPRPVIPLNYHAPSGGAAQRWSDLIAFGIPISWAVCAGGWTAIMTLDVKSVLITGPVLFGIGTIIIIAGVRTGSMLAMSLGICHCAVCLLFFGLVQLFSWGPGNAQKPFTIVGAGYVLAIAPLVLLSWLRRPRPV